MDSLDDLGVFGVLFDALAELGDVLVEGAAVGDEVESPAFSEEALAIDDLTALLVEQCEPKIHAGR